MLHAIIMAGGSGTRFWPRSRRNRPKQLLRLAGESTMLQQTVQRIEHLVPPERVLVITGAEQAAATREQLPALPARNIVAEPAPRDTAPCVALAAGLAVARDSLATMIVMPADHLIEPVEAFRESVLAAAEVVEEDPSTLLTFGITPNRPETGYGYIERGEPLGVRRGIPLYQVAQFREKPDRATAERFLAAGSFMWNSGIFVWRASAILEAIRAHCPSLGESLGPILSALGTAAEPDVLARHFPTLERVPIDRAVLERSPNVRVLEVPYIWNDVGDWRAVAELLERDAQGNAVQGHVVARDTRDSIVISDDDGVVATLGVEDLVVVHSGRATLVARKGRLDDLKALVESLAEAGYGAHL